MRKTLVGLGAVGLCAWGTAQAAPVPILEYSFNTLVPATTGDVASTGSDTTAVTMRNTAGAAADRRGAAGSGVSRLAGDLAFDNSQAASMGSASSGSYGRADQADRASVDGLRSFTVQGWIKPDTAPGSSARLLSNIGDGNTKGFEIGVGGASNRLRLSINTSLAGTASQLVDSGVDSNYAAVGQWTFFAVTYDGGATAGNVKFYVGTKAAGVTLVSPAVTLNMGTIPDDTAGGLTIGNYTGASGTSGRTYDGLLDNFRVFGSQTDSSAVLTLGELEGLRTTDVPEPSAVALGAVGVFGVLARRRRRVTVNGS
jgi:hypothetical protein